MSRRPYIPMQWQGNEAAYLAGWKDGEFGLALGAGAPAPQPMGRTGTDYRMLAYEAGFADFWQKNPQAGGGV